MGTREIIILADAASLIGGADKVAIVTSVELAKRGHNVTLLTAMGPPDTMLEGLENLTVVCLNQPEVDQAESRWKGFQTQLWNKEAMSSFASILKRTDQRNVVIHAHCYLKLLSSGVIKQALDSGLPFLMTMHDYGIACPNRLFYHQPEKAICHRKPMGASCLSTNCLKAAPYRKAGMVYRFWVQEHRAKIRERLKHVAFVSEFSQRILDPFLPKTCNQYVMQNPVDPQKEERVDVTANQVFTYVGRLVPEKDPVTLAIAARIANVPVTFVGEGPERVEILRENPKAEITGWVRPEQVHEKLRESRAFVIPSVWYECSPLVTVEALSHGLPVICSNTNASQESVEDGVTGFHFEAGNAESLAEKLTEMNSNDVADSMSQATYTRFWDDPPSTDRHINELEQLYEKVISTY